MIKGIGTDMVEIARIEGLLSRHGEAAARRILAPSELAAFQVSREPARFLAKRFAVKEALAKALGTGLRAPVLLSAIAIVHDELGKPELSLSVELQQFCDARGLRAQHVSISDERHYALAFVVLEG
jgi:holo-[acyl-carrier protein] synthase